MLPVGDWSMQNELTLEKTTKRGEKEKEKNEDIETRDETGKEKVYGI